MRTCPKCKKEYDDTWKVCLNCGIALEDGLEARLIQLEDQAKRILGEIDAIRKGGAIPAASAETKDRQAAEGVPSPASGAVLKEDTETRIGKYLLSKIGIVSVVAGVSFFLAYAFKYLSPLWKIGIGYAISAVMAMSGVLIERIKSYKWYGRGLVCGGWVTAYFTTYAMYHIAATKVISSQFVDLILVSVVVIAMLAHLLTYRSQSLVALAMFLGYVTACINLDASFACLYIAILALVSGILLVSMKWQALAAFSLLGTYIAHFISLRAYSVAQSGPNEFWVSAGFLTAYWGIYNVVSLFVKTENAEEERGLNGFILTNSLLFGMFCFMEIRAYNSAWKSPFALTAALILLAFGILSSYTRDKAHARGAFFVAAIAFVTAGLRFSISKGNAYFIWFLEIPALLWAGFYLGSAVYRVAAWGLTLITLMGMAVFFGMPNDKIMFFGKEMYHTLFLYLTGIVCFYLARQVYAGRTALSGKGEDELRLSNAYTILASVILVFLSYYEIQTKLVTLTWVVLAFLLFMAGFFTKDKIFRCSAIGLVAVSLIRGVTVDLAGINTAYRIIVFICLGFVLLAVSFWYAKMSGAHQDKNVSEEKSMKLASAITVLLIPVAVLTAVYFYPSEFRKEDKLKAREIEITARFMAGKDISDSDMAFLRGRDFKNLEKALLSLYLHKDGSNLDIYLRAVGAGVRSSALYNKLAMYYNEKDQKQKALEMYEKGIALDPAFKQWNTRYTARSAAKIYRSLGKYKEAAYYYEKYLAFTKNVEDLYELAICYERLGNLDKALEKLSEALRMDRRGTYSEEIISLRSDIYSKKGMVQRKKINDNVTILK